MGIKIYTLEPPMNQRKYHKGGQKISKTNKNEHTILYWTLKNGEDITFFFFYHNRNQMEELHNNKKVCKIQISLFFFGRTKIHFAFIARSGVLLVSSDNLLSRPC